MTRSGDTAAGTAGVTPELSFPSSKEEVVFCQLVDQTCDPPPAMEEETPVSEAEDGASEQSDDLPDSTLLSDIMTSGFFPLFLGLVTTIANFIASTLTAPMTPPGWIGKAPDSVAWLLAIDSNGKALDWPPPALIGLALLTIVALVVHPDGLTWILLRKLRSGMVSSLQSTTSWWALVVNDYGTLISSLLALATFASLFFLAYILHKTLSPKRDTTRPTTPEKQKKKKRRGNHHNKGNRSGGRIKGAQQQQQQTKSASVPAVSPEPALEFISTISSGKEEVIVQGNENVFSLPALVEDKPLSPRLAISVPSPERLIKALKEDTAPSRIRATSASTVDTTTTCSDDGTVSGRSTPTKAILPVTESVPAVSDSTGARADDGLFQLSATSARKEQSRRGKKHGNVDVSRAPITSDAVPIVPTSRWDALKPSRSVGAGRRVQPKGRTGPQQVVRFHSVQNRPNQQSSPLIKPIARPTTHSPTFSPAEPIHTPIHGSDLVVPREVVSPVAASLQSCEIGASTWSQLPTMSYEDRPLTGLLAPFARSPARDSSAAETLFASPSRTSDQTMFFSSELNANTSELNANSPSWSQANTNIASSTSTLAAAPSTGSVRAPPGLTLADGGNGLQASFSSQAPSETPFLSTYNDLSVRPCPQFSMPSLVSYNIKENPFDESDNEEDVDQIEAELQELGGQMVGSILDF